VPPEGFEPPTKSLEGSCSVQLSYGGQTGHRTLERVRGIEPPPPAWKAGALPLSYTRCRAESIAFGVGLAGFEPATPCSQSRCAAKLRHSPRRRHCAMSHAARQTGDPILPAGCAAGLFD
jgi:hypothetical protein